MTLFTEFPDYPVDTLPALPASFVDASWHNDTCPSFRSIALGLLLYVDYPDRASREIPDAPRYVLVPFEGDDVGVELVATESWNEMAIALGEYE